MKHELIVAYLKHIDHWIAGVEDAKIGRTIEGAGWHEFRFEYGNGYYSDVTIETLDLLAFIWPSPKAQENANE